MVKAIYNDKVLAEADSKDILMIEGNKYFPPDSVNMEFFEETDHHTVCPWKGDASYYSINIDGETLENAAWFYPDPKDGSNERVRMVNKREDADFKNYVAFYTDKVKIIEE
jgi:uncharacterized protein (DUF427 family)